VLPGLPDVAFQLELAHRLGHVEHLVPDSLHFFGRRLAGPDVHVPVYLTRVGGDDEQLDAQLVAKAQAHPDR
jgi:hypothetical protein